ncbi:hypothetical protein F2Q69_00053745 [Brassica cretica]|uniref:Uncharacterized protein n=1 Tax=Brassica cretica TaxID=69181 RepID=A0A8S9N3B5_BRACR|nr:hypothetical protein F2Q69_00053745 [Brassica cretica]
MFLYLKKESLHLRSISLRLSSSPTVFLPGSSSPRRITVFSSSPRCINGSLLYANQDLTLPLPDLSEKWERAGKKTDRDGDVEKASITTAAVTLVTTFAVMLEQPDRGGCRVASPSFPIPSQSLARHEVPLTLLSALYSLSQSFDMLNVEACFPSSTAVLLLPNARLIHVE